MNRKKTFRAKWTRWEKMSVVSLGQAVCLSFGYEPDKYHCHDSLDSPFVSLLGEPRDSKLSIRYQECLSAIANGDSGFVRKRYPSDAPRDMPFVHLREFGGWLKRNGHKIAERFPVSPTVVNEDNGGTVQVTFPYRCKFVEDIAVVMFDNYANLSETEKPNQKRTGMELDDRVGWKRKKSGSSRTAKAVVARLQPERFQKRVGK